MEKIYFTDKNGGHVILQIRSRLDPRKGKKKPGYLSIIMEAILLQR